MKKLIFFLVIPYIILWFIEVHYFKKKIIEIIKDNFSSGELTLNYRDIKVLGFPFKMQINIMEPVVTYNNIIGNTVFSFNNAVITPENLRFNQLNLQFSNDINIEHQYYNNRKNSYKILSDKFLTILMDLKKSLLLPNSYKGEHIKKIKFHSDYIIIKDNKDLISFIRSADINFKYSNHRDFKYDLIINGIFNLKDDEASNSINFSFKGSTGLRDTNVVNSVTVNESKKIKIHSAYLMSTNGNSSIQINGNLEFVRDYILPFGIINLNFDNNSNFKKYDQLYKILTIIRLFKNMNNDALLPHNELINDNLMSFKIEFLGNRVKFNN